MKTYYLRATCCFFLFSTAGSSSLAWCNAQDTQGPQHIIDQAWKIVEERYLDPSYNHHDSDTIRREFLTKRQFNTSEEYSAARAMLELLGDFQTRFLDPAQLSSTVREFTGELGGVGFADPWLVRDEESGYLKVLHVIADSPAFKGGLHPGDLVLEIDGAPTRGLLRDDALLRTRGPAGSKLHLEIGRGAKRLHLDLVREALTMHTVTARPVAEKGESIGYVQLTQFAGKSPQEMREALEELFRQGVRGFLVDLRNNPGGFVPASRRIAGLFLSPNQTIYQEVDRTGSKTRVANDTSPVSTLPVVVLVNAATASAAEILAGTMQQNGRAKLVGTQTFGQALIHSVQPLSDGSGIILAVGRFLTPDGSDIRGRGLVPDLKISGTETETARGSTTDAQFREALKVLVREIEIADSPS